MSQKPINDDDLQKVNGGVNTGDYNKDHTKIYIKFPLIVSQLSGYYSCEDLENLCIQYQGFADLVKEAIDKKAKQAIIQLYKDAARPIPQIVTDVTGVSEATI